MELSIGRREESYIIVIISIKRTTTAWPLLQTWHLMITAGFYDQQSESFIITLTLLPGPTPFLNLTGLETITGWESIRWWTMVLPATSLLIGGHIIAVLAGSTNTNND